jgi:PKD repeat protein
MAATRARSARGRCAATLAALAAALAPASAPAQAPLFAFAQISDVQINDAIDLEHFEDVLDALAEAGSPGALLPHPVAVVFVAGDLVNMPHAQSEWVQFGNELEQELTAHGIPFLAVPGNHDQDEFGAPEYEDHIAGAGVWDTSSAELRGQNEVVTATGWAGLRFVGLNTSWAGWNTVKPADLAQARAIASAAAAADESVFVVGHHPHAEFGPIPLAPLLEIPGVVGYLRGHAGAPHATLGLAGVANPVWDLSSESVMRDAALLYYEVHPAEVRVYVLKLVTDPTSLPPPEVIALPHALTPAPAPSAPAAAFAAQPGVGRAPLEVAFADLSTGHPDEWLWDFGDGETSTERHPIHVYQAVGPHDVSLEAENDQGSDAHTEVAAVLVLPPLAGQTFVPTADARVSSGSPSQNFGGSSTFRVRLAPASTEQSYLRFLVQGLEEQRVVRAALRLFVTDPSVEGGALTAAPCAWDEATLDWSNAPGVGGTQLDSVATVFPESWVELDASALVKGPGTWCFGLSSSSSNSAIYSSREGSHPPELVVSTAVAVPSLDAAATALLAAALAATGAEVLSGRPPRLVRGPRARG